MATKKVQASEATEAETVAPAKATRKTPVRKAAAAEPAKKPATKRAAKKDAVDEVLDAPDIEEGADEEETDKKSDIPENLPQDALVLSSQNDEDEVPVYSAAITGATADPVKDYLKQIGKVALLNAAEEVELAMRIEAGLFAEDKLANEADGMTPQLPAEVYSLHSFRFAMIVQFVVIAFGVVMLFRARRRTRSILSEDGIEVGPVWVAMIARLRRKDGRDGHDAS